MEIREKAASSSNQEDHVNTMFVCRINPDARDVFLVGDFNDWDPNAHRMQKRNNLFFKQMKLPPGIYQYKFLVDGEWHVDPEAEENPAGKLGKMVSFIQI